LEVPPIIGVGEGHGAGKPIFVTDNEVAGEGDATVFIDVAIRAGRVAGDGDRADPRDHLHLPFECGIHDCEGGVGGAPREQPPREVRLAKARRDDTATVGKQASVAAARDDGGPGRAEGAGRAGVVEMAMRDEDGGEVAARGEPCEFAEDAGATRGEPGVDEYQAGIPRFEQIDVATTGFVQSPDAGDDHISQASAPITTIMAGMPRRTKRA